MKTLLKSDISNEVIDDENEVDESTMSSPASPLHSTTPELKEKIRH